ncbi:hypothetical protein IAT38_000672 [Cryptococcus sp. DSM 104549]
MPPKSRCGNPVFLQFMEELRDEARERGTKSAEAYGKAHRAIAACPTTFDHPRELIQLTNVGDRTVQLLEKKWKVWLGEQGVDPESILPPAPKGKGKGKGKRNADEDEDDAPDPAAKPKKARKPAAPKTYIPTRGSGAYGILMALVLAIDQPHVNTQVFLTKTEIIRVAQVYSDTSYDHSEKGTYYTAWNGMKILVEKGYVYVTGNPHKHCLTEEGYDVAVTIRNLRPEFAHMEKAPFSHDPSSGAPRPSNPNASLSRSTSFPAPGPASSPIRPPSTSYSKPRALPSRSTSGPGPEKFRFWYISPSGERTLHVDSAHIRLDPVEYVGLKKIEFREAQRGHAFASQLRLVDENAKVRDGSQQPTLFGYVLEAEAPPKCSTFVDSEDGPAKASGSAPTARASGSGSAGSGVGGHYGGGAKDALAGRTGSWSGSGRGATNGRSASGSSLGVTGPLFLDDSDDEPLPPLPKSKPRPPVPGRSAPSFLDDDLAQAHAQAQARALNRPGSSSSFGAGAAGDKYPLDGILGRSSAGSGSGFGRTSSAPAGSVGSAGPGGKTGSLSSLSVDPAMRRVSGTSALAGRSHSAVVSLASGSASSSSNAAPRPGPRLSSHVPSPFADNNDDDDSSPSLFPQGPPRSAVPLPAFTLSDAIVFPAGSYEILLIVDTREVESRNNRDKIAETLRAKGVAVETRALRLGDMCWVARRTEGGLGGEEDECVLDYVVERKRLDDLCSSIKDGRYNEQCFRLSNSALTNIYYIVEDFQVNVNMDANGLQIRTAKSQIQLHNRFHLKETSRLPETIDFLATMTSVIKASHRGLPLRVIPTRFLSRSTYSPLQQHLKWTYPDETFHTSFAAYQELNDKSGSVTLKEKFGRMLLCVKQMSAERVASVLDVWETPRELWEDLKAWEMQPEEEEDESQSQAKGKGKNKKRGKDMFFADRVPGQGRRKIGDALSRDLWKAFMGTESAD